MPLGIAFDRLSFQGLHFTETPNGLQISVRFIATNLTGDQKLVDLSGLPAGLTATQQQTVRTLVRRLVAAYAQQVLGTNLTTSRLDATRDGMITEVPIAAPAIDPTMALPDQFAG